MDWWWFSLFDFGDVLETLQNFLGLLLQKHQRWKGPRSKKEILSWLLDLLQIFNLVCEAVRTCSSTTHTQTYLISDSEFPWHWNRARDTALNRRSSLQERKEALEDIEEGRGRGMSGHTEPCERPNSPSSLIGDNTPTLVGIHHLDWFFDSYKTCHLLRGSTGSGCVF